MTKHAVRSPSSSARWMACPGSIVIAPEGGKSSRAAAEGSIMHRLAEDELTGNGSRVAARLGEVHKRDGFEIEVTQEMVDAVEAYVNEARQAIGDDHFEVEVSVPVGHITGEPGARGTADLVIFRRTELEVRDAKFGRGVEVDADNNTQLLLYALGALDLYEDGLGDIDTVRIVIHQPRLAGPKEAVYTRQQMGQWRTELVQAAAKIDEAAERREKVSEALWNATYLQPTNSGCKFCPAKATCPALRAEVMAAVAGDFADLENEDAPELGKDFARIERVEAWCKAVRAEAERRLLAGKEVPGLKLVAGRRGARRWIDELEADKALKEALGDDRWERSLLSPTKAAKLVAGRVDLDPLTTSAEGKPSVAFETDKRPAISVVPTTDDFDNLEEN